MERATLDFQGTHNLSLLLALLAAVAGVTAVVGVVLLARRRWREGAICMGAALGPAGLIPVLLVSAVQQYIVGKLAGFRHSLVAVAAVIALGAAAVAAIIAAGGYVPAIWMTLLGLETVLVVSVFYAGVYEKLKTPQLIRLIVLRCLAILVLLLLLFKPALSVMPGGDAHKPLLPILVDRSESMSAVDEANLPKRYDMAIQMLATQEQRLRKYFRPAWFDFAAEPHPAESLEALRVLQPAGPGTDSTNIAAAIRTAATNYERQTLPGMLLLSDGNHNTASSVPDAVRVAGVPIYVAGLGGQGDTAAGQKNIALVSVDAPLLAVKNNVATITARVRLSGISSGEVQLLADGSDTPADSATLATGKNSETLSAELKWVPKDVPDTGPVRTLRVRIVQHPADTVPDDNEMELHVLVTEPRLRVLYIEGSIRPEYKFLRRYLDSDRNVQFMGLIRVHDEQFMAQGHLDGKQLTRLPRTKDDFALFDVLIIGDVDRSLWTNEQMDRVRAFVNNGGGLLMLGGYNSFGPGGYDGTAIEQVLPVRVGPRSQTQEKTAFVPQLTAAGEVHPIFAGITGYFYGPGGRKPDEKLASLPKLTGCVSVISAKQGANVLAVHPRRNNAAGPLIVLAVQQFGAGRSAALTADTTWQWYRLLQSMGVANPYQRFWGQLIRWLANVDTKSRAETASVLLRLDRPCLQAGEPLHVLARVQDAKGQLPVNAVVTCRFEPVGSDGRAASLSLAAGMERGLYENNIDSLTPGRYRVTVSAVDAEGKEIGSDMLPLLVTARRSEMEHLARNTDLLRGIASESGGRYADITALPELIDTIIARQQDRPGGTIRAQVYPLYQFPLLFGAFVVLMTAEWALRRRWQLR